MKTLTVDDERRVRLPDIEPQTTLSYDRDADGVIHLKQVGMQERPRAKVRYVEKDGFTVATTDQPITMEAIKDALADSR